MSYTRTPISLGGTTLAIAGRKVLFAGDAHPLSTALYRPVWSKGIGHSSVLSRIQAPDGRPYPLTFELNPPTEAAKEALAKICDPAAGLQWFIMEGDDAVERRIQAQCIGLQRGRAPTLWQAILWAPSIMLEAMSMTTSVYNLGADVSALTLANAGDGEAFPTMTIRPLLPKTSLYGRTKQERVIVVNESEFRLRDPHSRGGLGRGYPVYVASAWDTRELVRDSGTTLSTIADGGDGITSGQKTIGLADTSGLPRSGMGWLGAAGWVGGGEQIAWGDKNDSTDELLDCRRGLGGTTPGAHAEAVVLYASEMQADARDLAAYVNGVEVPAERLTIDGPYSATTEVVLPMELPGKVDAPLASALIDPALTLSGNEQTDALRALAAVAGDDGRDPERSFGVWEASANGVSNPGFELDTASWFTGGNNVITRDTDKAKHGVASCRCDYADDLTLLRWIEDVGGAGTFAFSAWVYIPAAWDGGAIQLEAVNYAGAGGTLLALADDALRDQWQRISLVCSIAGGDTNGELQITASGAPTAGATIYVDSCQIEEQPLATPYHDPTRAAARVRVPAAVLDETQGWAAFRLVPRWGNGNEPHADPRVLSWRDDVGARIELFYDTSENKWRLDRGATETVSSALATITSGIPVTVIVMWDGSKVYVSIDGGAFVSAAATTIPVIAASTLDLLSRAGTAEWFDGEVLWVAFGTGALSDGDAAVLDALGATSPKSTDLPELAAVTAVWTCTDGYLDAGEAALQRGIESMRVPGYVYIGTECLRYEARNVQDGKLLHLVRGCRGTTPAAHAIGAQVDRVPLDIVLAYGWADAPARPTNPDPIAFTVANSSNIVWEWAAAKLYTVGASPGAWVAERTGENRLASAVYLDNDGSGGTRFRDIASVSNLLPFDSVTLPMPCGLADAAAALEYDLTVDAEFQLQIETRDLAGVRRLFGNRHGHEEAGATKYHELPEVIANRQETFATAGVQSAVTLRARQSVVTGVHIADGDESDEGTATLFTTGVDLQSFVFTQTTKLDGIVVKAKTITGDRDLRIILCRWDGQDPETLVNVINTTDWTIDEADLDAAYHKFCYFPPDGELVLAAGNYLVIAYWINGTTGGPVLARSDQSLLAAGNAWEHDGSKYIRQDNDLVMLLIAPETDNQEDAPCETAGELLLKNVKIMLDSDRTPTVSRQAQEPAYHIRSFVSRSGGESAALDFVLPYSDVRPALEVTMGDHDVVNTEYGDRADSAIDPSDKSRWIIVPAGGGTYVYRSAGAQREQVTLEARAAWQS